MKCIEHKMNKYKICPNCGEEIHPDQFDNYLCTVCGWDPDD